MRHPLFSFPLLLSFLMPVIAAEVVVDDPGGSVVSGTWSTRTEVQHSGTYLDGGSRFSGNANAAYRYQSTLPTAGLWSFEIWTGDTLNRTDSTALITHGDGSASTSFNLNQSTVNSNLGGGKDQWLSLGTYDFSNTAATYEYTLTLANSAGNQRTDAVRWVSLDDSPSSLAVGVRGGISGDFYGETGSGWVASGNKSGLYGVPNRLTSNVGDSATYAAPLAGYQYEIFMTFNADPSRSTAALVEILDAGGTTHALRVDQTTAPSGNSAFGLNWLSLGTYDFDGSSLVSVIADSTALAAGDFVVADGVRFVPIAAIIPEPASLALLGLALAALLLSRTGCVRRER